MLQTVNQPECAADPQINSQDTQILEHCHRITNT